MKKLILALSLILVCTILPSFASAAGVDSSAPIQKDIAGVSPQVASAAKPLFTVIDSARIGIDNTLSSQLVSTKAKLATVQKPSLVVASSTTADPTITNPWGSLWFVLYTAYVYILTILIWLVDTAEIFYPVIALLVLYILFRIYRRWRRPRY